MGGQLVIKASRCAILVFMSRNEGAKHEYCCINVEAAKFLQINFFNRGPVSPSIELPMPRKSRENMAV